MHRQTKGGKNGKKYDKSDDSDFSGGDLDFSLQLQSQRNIGKRTGRVIKEKNWKKNTEGFFDVEIQPDDSLTPQTKIAQLKQFLGLHREEQQSLKNKNQPSSEDNQSSQIQQQRQEPNKRRKSPPQKKNIRRSTAFNKNNKRMTRKTQFSFSFSFDLDDNLNDNLMEASFSSEQTDFQDGYSLINNKKQVRKSGSGKVNKNNDNKQPIQQITKKQQPQKEQLLSKPQFKEEEQYERNKQDKQKFVDKQTKGENKKQITKQQTKQISLRSQEVKPSASRSQFQRKSDKITAHSLVVESQKKEFNFQGKQSIRKDFKDISEIKANQRSLDFSIDNDLMLGLFLGEIENNPSNSETAGELNKAVINTQTENTKEDDEKETKEKELQFNKKAKQLIEKQQKPKKTFVKNSQSELEIEKKKSFEKQQERKNALPKSKKSKESYFLTQSLRKQAHFYYEKQKKQNQQKQNLQNKIKKTGKRQLQFQTVETSDLLDEQKLQQMRSKSEHQKGLKKVKSNEPPTRIQKSEKDKDKEKILRKESLPQKIPQKKSKKFSFERIQQRVSEQYEDDDFVPDQKQKQQKIKMNNRVVKQADKIFKRKERPQRVSPVEKKALKKSQTMSVQRKPNTMRLDKGSRAKTEVDRLMKDNRNYSVIIDDSMLQSGRKYPKRHRFGRVQAWKGEKILYDLDGNAVQVQSKQLIRLIGLVNERSLDSEITIVKGDRYVQKILLQPRQIVEFEGFDDKFRELHITYIRKSKGNYDKVNRTVQVLQDGETTKLIEPRVIEANSGRFIIMNKSQGSAYLELILFKNDEFEI